MSEVNPPTDEELLIYREWDAHPLTYPRLAVRTVTAALFARIESDRAEIASVRKAAASKDRVIEQQAEEIARLKAERKENEDGLVRFSERLAEARAENAGLRAEIDTLKRSLAEADANVVMLKEASACLKAEVERLSACHACEGIGTIFVHVGVSTTITRGVQCLCCNGTGRAR